MGRESAKRRKEIEQEFDRLGVVRYDPPLPLVRIPVNPQAPPWLGFRSEEDKSAAHKTCRINVANRCRKGARNGCAVQAAKQCKCHWLLKIFGWKEREWPEIEACEKKVMQECVAMSEEQCSKHATNFCHDIFRNQCIVNGERNQASVKS